MKKLYLALPLIFVSLASKAEQTVIVNLKPGDRIAEIVADAPAGTTFNLAPGVYRYQSVQPKDRQKFIGKGDVVLNGATVLTDWQLNDGLWVAVWAEPRRHPSGSCRKEAPLCSHREDLFVDGIVYQKVASAEEVTSGKWYDDGVNIHISDDPTNRKTELSVMPYAFAGDAESVVIKDIVVEKYASAAQRGAIEHRTATGWQLINVVARWNHGVGARVGPGTLISGGSYSHNGQLGIGGGYGTGIVIENVEIAHNNYAQFNEGWEAGGTKFVKADGLIVRNACVHNNDGPGLWTDIDNVNIVFADNLVFDNMDDGIKHEISYSAKIHGNTVARNGRRNENWLWSSQILIQNSQNVQVYDNIVEVGRGFGNGISVINQKRGTGSQGEWLSQNNSVFNNTIIHLGAQGMNGVIADYKNEWFDTESANKFYANSYVVPKLDRSYFVVNNKGKRINELPKFGMEKGAKLEIAKREPLKLACPA